MVLQERDTFQTVIDPDESSVLGRVVSDCLGSQLALSILFCTDEY